MDNNLNWVGSPLVIIYFISMFVWPVIEGKADWQHVQDVWHRWQSFNVGVLALMSSLVAFNISKFNAEKKEGENLLQLEHFSLKL